MSETVNTLGLPPESARPELRLAAEDNRSRRRQRPRGRQIHRLMFLDSPDRRLISQTGAATWPRRLPLIRRTLAVKNMGTLDRGIRLVAVAAVMGAYGLGLISGAVALVLGAVAVILLLTSLTATCPAYMPFGLSTRPRRR